MRRRQRLLAGLSAVVLLAAGALAVALVTGRSDGVRQEVLRVPVGPGPDGAPVTLDATLFLPRTSGPAPAVVLAHGFGGSKDDEAPDALDLAGRGYVVLTYSARGFGRSGGRISLDSPRYEVPDAQRLVDLLGRRPEVQQDGPGDPRVGFAGASYGGALSLLVAGYDRRVDAIAPSITWHDLRQALFPQNALTGAARPSPAAATPIPVPGVFKKQWAGIFFGAGGAPKEGRPTVCGRFAADVCAAYTAVAADGRPTQQVLDLLAERSPAAVLDRITAPTLLIQGEADSLFPLSEGEANARGIAAHGTPVKVVWYGGGHDGGLDETNRLRALTASWFDSWLRRTSAAGTRFEATLTARAADQDGLSGQVRAAPGLPGVTAPGPPATTAVGLHGDEQVVVSPAGGTPAVLTSLPGLGSTLSQLGAAAPGAEEAARPPGQTARFDSGPLPSTLHLVGSPTVELRVSSAAGDATLFVGLEDVPGDGGTGSLPEQLVAPVRLTRMPAAGTVVRVALPALVHDFPAGHRLHLTVSSTDQGYAVPATARTYTLALAGSGQVVLPLVTTTAVGGGGSTGPVLAATSLAAVVVAGAAVLAIRRRRRRVDIEEGLADVPLALRGLGKAYAGGYRAVADLSFRVERGQVLGLLGPNGAGKTTTLRMLMGLIHPTEGELRVFGHRVVPGAPVLSRVGAFVEGPGFLPHLSGRENLELYWRATGRPAADARTELALEIAGLGEDLSRRVRTYSHGMRQRLAIAQAMLGLPDLLVLDEPTNGLDPPQIREMREVLTRYAATGRTVVLSSHLLGEVEQTCTDVVVMHRGRLVAEGPVAKLLGSAETVAVDVDDPRRAALVAADVLGVRDVEITPTGITLRLVGTPRGELLRALVAAGIDVDALAPRHALEQVFLTLVGEG